MTPVRAISCEGSSDGADGFGECGIQQILRVSEGLEVIIGSQRI